MNPNNGNIPQGRLPPFPQAGGQQQQPQQQQPQQQQQQQQQQIPFNPPLQQQQQIPFNPLQQQLQQQQQPPFLGGPNMQRPPQAQFQQQQQPPNTATPVPFRNHNSANPANPAAAAAANGGFQQQRMPPPQMMPPGPPPFNRQPPPQPPLQQPGQFIPPPGAPVAAPSPNRRPSSSIGNHPSQPQQPGQFIPPVGAPPPHPPPSFAPGAPAVPSPSRRPSSAMGQTQPPLPPPPQMMPQGPPRPPGANLVPSFGPTTQLQQQQQPGPGMGMGMGGMSGGPPPPHMHGQQQYQTPATPGMINHQPQGPPGPAMRPPMGAPSFGVNGGGGGPGGPHMPAYPQSTDSLNSLGSDSDLHGTSGGGGIGAGGVAGMTSQFNGMNIMQQHPPNSFQHQQPQQNPASPQILNLLSGPPPVNDCVNPFSHPWIDPLISVAASSVANCDPRYKRCTLNAIPSSIALLGKCKVPLGLLVTPYRCLLEGEDSVPVINPETIVRCRRCRTYINPWVQFTESNTRWKCNLCYLSNEVPSFFDWEPETMKPLDRSLRPELNHGIIEFIAPQEYMVRPPQPVVFLFLLDVSFHAVNSGLLATAAKTILENLEKVPNADARAQVAFIAFDSNIHFFCFDPDLSEPRMLVISDLEEIFLPTPEDLMVPISEAKDSIQNFLTRLPEMFKNNQNVGNCLGRALQFAYKLIVKS